VIYGDGQDTRDQLHGRDVARAFEQALATDAVGGYNVSDGERQTIVDLAGAATRAAGLPGAPERRPAQKPAVDFHVRIGKARGALHFAPEVSLERGVEEQLRWLRNTPS
jgi:UDP-glucose 4-epimerase